MYCLSKLCHICLQPKNDLKIVKSPCSIDEDLHYIITNFALSLNWLKEKQFMFSCEECYTRLRNSYEFLKTFHKNGTILQGYIRLLTNSVVSEATAELSVNLEDDEAENNKIKFEIAGENECDSYEEIAEETEESSDLRIKQELIWQTEQSEVEYQDDVSVDDECLGFTIEEIHASNQKQVSTSEQLQIIQEDINKVEYDIKVEIITDNWAEGALNSLCHSEIDLKEDILYETEEEEVDVETVVETKVSNKKNKKLINETPYKCLQCNKSFNTSAYLKIHLRLHSGVTPHKCPICERYSITNSDLMVHIRRHTGERPYKCTTCSKTFINKCDVERHMRVHTGQKPYRCSACNINFRLKSELVQHMHLTHGEKPYKCRKCNLVFDEKYPLHLHRRTHRSSSFKCDVCNKFFRQTSHLERHRSVHYNTKPYKCTICIRYYKTRSTLLKHIRTQH